MTFQPKPLDADSGARLVEGRSLRDPALREWMSAHGDHGGGWDLQRLTLAAFHYHPAIAEARADWQAAQAAIGTAKQRPNPSASVAPEYNFTKGASTPWVLGLSIEVPIETAGKRGLRTLQAQETANAARCRLAAAAQKVRAGVRLALVDAAAAEARLALLEEQRRIQEDLVKLLKEGVEAGTTARTELTTYQLALNRAALDVAAARRDAASSRARLAAAVGLPGHALDGVKLVFDLKNVATPSSSARNAASRSHPEVLGALADYAAAEAALRLEIARQYPDLKLGSGFQWDQDDHKWQLPGLGMELPVFHHNEAAIAEAEAKRTAAATRLTSAQVRIRGDIDAALAGLTGSQAQATEAAKLLDEERKAEQSAEANLKAGGGDRLELLTAQLQSAAGRVSLLEAQILAQQSAAALEDAVQPPQLIEPVMK